MNEWRESSIHRAPKLATERSFSQTNMEEKKRDTVKVQGLNNPLAASVVNHFTNHVPLSFSEHMVANVGVLATI